MATPLALAPALPSAGIVLAVLAVAGVFLLPHARGRAIAAVAALIVAPALLLGELWDNPQIESLRDRPLALALAIVGAVALVGGLAAVFVRRPGLLPILAFIALPFRIPVEAGGDTANLLVPLYGVIAAGVAAYAWTRLTESARAAKADGRAWVAEEEEPRRVELAIVVFLLLYALQAGWSSDFEQAVKNVAFFYVPFALLMKLLTQVAWTRKLALACLGATVTIALACALIGFWEYATKELLWNSKVIESNQFESYFRVNSLFYDPNIYGRYLALVMIAMAGVLLWEKRPRDIAITALTLAVLWGGLVLTFSQSSFAALLIGLVVIACIRWKARPILIGLGGLALVGVILVLAAPGLFGIEGGSSSAWDKATSGRFGLLEGGAEMFLDRPVAGYGSGSFAQEYREREDVSSDRAASASHTIPVTIAAEQGVIGLAAYGFLLYTAFAMFFGRIKWTSRRGPPTLPPLGRTIVAACFTALVFHTMTYAAFLEDPITWTLLALGIALRAVPAPTPQQSSTSLEQTRAGSSSR
jgi:O-antigen ligase